MFKSLFGKPALPPEPAPAGAAIAAASEAAARDLIAQGNQLEDAGDLGAACDCYRKAVALAPGLVSAQLNLGIGLAATGDAAGAKAAYEAALAIEPAHAFVNYNFARLARPNDLQLALTLVRQALRTKPDFVEAHVLLAALLEEAGQLDAALISLDAAIVLQPGFLGARVNRALLLSKLARDEEGIAEAEHVLREDPSNGAMLERLATLQLRQRRMEAAMRTVRESIERHPGNFEFRSRELFLLNFDESQSPQALFDRHVEFGRRIEAAYPERFRFAPRTARALRRLRIGFVSSDFFAHPVSIFAIPVLERRDRERFEVFCYSTGRRADEVTARVRGLADHWIDASNLDDGQLARLIHGDAIDVLVDLAGHTGTPRMGVFAQRPAPVQVSWMGYLQTTGLSRMDYRLTDARSTPHETSAALHTERLVPLEGGQWCYRPFVDIEAATRPPFLDNGFITFGCFTQASKVTPHMCRRWANILRALPDAHLQVSDVSSAVHRAQLEQAFATLGIAPDRLRLLPRMELPGYFAAFHAVDIGLDTYPYGGGTTTIDALWMNVPVVTALGATPMSRSAASVLLELGLDEWVAPRIEDYETLAIRRAQDRDALERLRSGLRGMLRASALMDESGFTRKLEAAFDRMWAERGI